MMETSLSSLSMVVLAIALMATASQAEGGLAELSGAESPLQDGERIIFFGDSITQAGTTEHGYITKMQQALDAGESDAEVTLINRGISGHKVPDLQGRLQEHVLDEQPTVVWIYIGINDVWHSQSGRGTPHDKYEAGLRDLVKKIQESGAVVVLATPSVIGEKHDGSNTLDEMLDRYAATTRTIAKEMDVQLCDLREAFLAHLREHNSEQAEKGILTTDGVHLNPAGNALVAEQAAGAIAEALRKR
ncbi:MAG: SGNH/GDSL hydrolase family protein [Phycisphaeraceae bacterium]